MPNSEQVSTEKNTEDIAIQGAVEVGGLNTPPTLIARLGEGISGGSHTPPAGGSSEPQSMSPAIQLSSSSQYDNRPWSEVRAERKQKKKHQGSNSLEVSKQFHCFQYAREEAMMDTDESNFGSFVSRGADYEIQKQIRMEKERMAKE